ncbi:hypothetical protein EDC01DRAFT_760434 [Geopyxis carbonaria]|nr:hypothetical protein EDC01DRAFT_760434 [Geopyxis carbonaria]
MRIKVRWGPKPPTKTSATTDKTKTSKATGDNTGNTEKTTTGNTDNTGKTTANPPATRKTTTLTKSSSSASASSASGTKKPYGTRTSTDTIVPSPLTSEQRAIHLAILAAAQRRQDREKHRREVRKAMKARNRAEGQKEVMEKVNSGEVKVVEILDD